MMERMDAILPIKRARRVCLFGAAVGLAICVSRARADDPWFTGLGDLSGGATYSEVWGISGDGRTVVGGSNVGGGGFSPILAAFRWTQDEGLVSIFDESSVGGSARAFSASHDGSVIVGTVDYGPFSNDGIQAFYWSAATGAVLIGDLPGGNSGVPRGYARAVSGDAGVIAGIGESANGVEAFRYDTESAQMSGLGDLPGGPFSSSAYGISFNGSIIVGLSLSGTQEYQGFRWTASTGMRGLGFLTPAPGLQRYSLAEAISADGTIIVGESRSVAAGNGYEAVRWTPTGIQALGDLPGGGFQSWAYAVSGDGSVVVGRGSVPGGGPFGGSYPRAFIWDAAHGMRDLPAVLASCGLDITGWRLDEARGVSADGYTIVGNGLNPQGNNEAWVAHLPRPRNFGDLDCNNLVTDADMAAFLLALLDPDQYAASYPGCDMLNGDFNQDGAVDGDDVGGFVRCAISGICG